MKVATKLFGSVLALILSFSTAFAQDRVIPEQKITGAEKPIPPGEIVFLDLSKVEKPPAGYIKYHVSWKIIDNGENKHYNTMPDGSIFFGSGLTKRTITVYACVSYLYEDKKDAQITAADVRSSLLTAQIKIGDDSPNPPPPGPDVPVFPDGKYKLAAISYKLAREKVSAPPDRVLAIELAKSFRTKVKDIKDGKYAAVKDILADTKKSNRAVIDTASESARTKWDEFFTALQDEIYNLYTNKKLVVTDDFVIAWNEIADGLEKVPLVAGKK